MDKELYGVHQTHCCIEHGCKYGDEDCPVTSGEIKQDYICEWCSEDGIKSVNELLSKTKYLSLEEKQEIINQQIRMNEYHWGSTGEMLCKECLTIFKTSFNLDKVVKFCPICGATEIIDYNEYFFGVYKLE